jgi:outer membrane lipoprotein SlyB
MINNLKLVSLAACITFAAACTDDPYAPIVDGAKGAKYQQDLASCKQLSLEKSTTKAGATGGAVVGGLIGAAEADSGDALGGAVVGAVIGGLLGSAGENEEVDTARDQIVFNCLRGRGHNVVG